MKILELKSSNIKQLDEKQNLVFITGKNAQGKTSVLDSIWYALGGTKIAPEKPIREGQEEAKIELNLGDYKVVRTYTEKGSYLKVENVEGAKYSNPQDLLNKIVGQLSFDPLEFARMEAKKQVATLVNLTGLDFSEIDERHKALTEERQFAGRELKAMGEIPLETIAACEETAKKPEISIKELSDKLAAENKIHTEFEQVQVQIRNNTARIESFRKQISELESANAELSKIQDTTANLEELRGKLSGAETENSAIRDAKRIIEEATARTAKQKAYDGLTEQLEKLAGEKQAKLAAAKMPIEGLSFTEAGVLYNSIPFEQLSAAEQLKVSMAMAIASNPKLKVILIRDGSLLDKDNIVVITELAKEFDFQVWVEAVRDDKTVGIVIEDGEIVANNYKED